VKVRKFALTSVQVAGTGERSLSKGPLHRIKIMRTVSWHNKIDNNQGIRYGGASDFPEKRLVNCLRSKQLESVQDEMFIARAVGKLRSLLLQWWRDGDNRGNFQLSNIMQYKSANGSDTLAPTRLKWWRVAKSTQRIRQGGGLGRRGWQL